MAKKDKDYFDASDDDFDSMLDKFPGDINDFNPDNIDGADKDRNPIVAKLKSINSSLMNAGDAFLEGAGVGIGKAVEREFPDVKETHQAITDVLSEISTIRREAADQIVPFWNQTKRTLRRIGTQLEGQLPLGLDKKILKLAGEEETSGYGNASQKDIRNEQMRSNIDEIFKLQQESVIEQKRDNILQHTLDRRITNIQHKENATFLAKIAESVNFNQVFTSTVFTNYLKKDLELKYKQFYATEDILGVMTNHAKAVDTKLDAVIKNTALPDADKIYMSERVKANLKNRISGTVSDKITNYFSDMRKKIVDSIKDLVETGSMALMPLDMLADFSEMGKDLGMGTHKVSPGGMLASWMFKLLGGASGNLATHKLSKLMTPESHELLKNVLPGTGKQGIVAMLDMIKNGTMKVPEPISWLRPLLQNFAPDLGNTNYSIVNDAWETRENAGKITSKFIKTVEDVIPGYLRMQTKYLERLATGNNSAEERFWDYKNEKFVTRTEQKGIISDKLFGSSEDRTYYVRARALETANAIKHSTEAINTLQPSYRKTLERAQYANSHEIELFKLNLAHSKHNCQVQDDWLEQLDIIGNAEDRRDLKDNSLFQDGFKNIKDYRTVARFWRTVLQNPFKHDEFNPQARNQLNTMLFNEKARQTANVMKTSIEELRDRFGPEAVNAISTRDDDGHAVIDSLAMMKQLFVDENGNAIKLSQRDFKEFDDAERRRYDILYNGKDEVNDDALINILRSIKDSIKGIEFLDKAKKVGYLFFKARNPNLTDAEINEKVEKVIDKVNAKYTDIKEKVVETKDKLKATLKQMGVSSVHAGLTRLDDNGTNPIFGTLRDILFTRNENNKPVLRDINTIEDAEWYDWISKNARKVKMVAEALGSNSYGGVFLRSLLPDRVKQLILVLKDDPNTVDELARNNLALPGEQFAATRRAANERLINARVTSVQRALHKSSEAISSESIRENRLIVNRSNADVPNIQPIIKTSQESNNVGVPEQLLDVNRQQYNSLVQIQKTLYDFYAAFVDPDSRQEGLASIIDKKFGDRQIDAINHARAWGGDAFANASRERLNNSIARYKELALKDDNSVRGKALRRMARDQLNDAFNAVTDRAEAWDSTGDNAATMLGYNVSLITRQTKENAKAEGGISLISGIKLAGLSKDQIIAADRNAAIRRLRPLITENLRDNAGGSIFYVLASLILNKADELLANIDNVLSDDDICTSLIDLWIDENTHVRRSLKWVQSILKKLETESFEQLFFNPKYQKEWWHDILILMALFLPDGLITTLDAIHEVITRDFDKSNEEGLGKFTQGELSKIENLPSNHPRRREFITTALQLFRERMGRYVGKGKARESEMVMTPARRRYLAYLHTQYPKRMQDTVIGRIQNEERRIFKHGNDEWQDEFSDIVNLYTDDPTKLHKYNTREGQADLRETYRANYRTSQTYDSRDDDPWAQYKLDMQEGKFHLGQEKTVAEAIIHALHTMGHVFSVAWGGMSKAFNKVVTDPLSKAYAAGAYAGHKVLNTINGITGLYEKAWNTITDPIDDLSVRAIFGAQRFGYKVGDVIHKVPQVWQNTKDYANLAKYWVTDTVPQKIRDVRDTAAGLTGNGWGYFNAAKDAVNNAWQSTKKKVRDVKTDVVDYSKLAGWGAYDLGAFGAKKAVDAGDAIINFMGNDWAQTKTDFDTAKNKVSNTVTNVKDDIVDWGKEIGHDLGVLKDDVRDTLHDTKVSFDRTAQVAINGLGSYANNISENVQGFGHDVKHSYDRTTFDVSQRMGQYGDSIADSITDTGARISQAYTQGKNDLYHFGSRMDLKYGRPVWNNWRHYASGGNYDNGIPKYLGMLSGKDLSQIDLRNYRKYLKLRKARDNAQSTDLQLHYFNQLNNLADTDTLNKYNALHRYYNQLTGQERKLGKTGYYDKLKEDYDLQYKLDEITDKNDLKGFKYKDILSITDRDEAMRRLSALTPAEQQEVIAEIQKFTAKAAPRTVKRLQMLPMFKSRHGLMYNGVPIINAAQYDTFKHLLANDDRKAIDDVFSMIGNSPAVAIDGLGIIARNDNVPRGVLLHELSHITDAAARVPESAYTDPNFVTNAHSNRGARFEKRADWGAVKRMLAEGDVQGVREFVDWLKAMDPHGVSDIGWRTKLIERAARRYGYDLNNKKYAKGDNISFSLPIDQLGGYVDQPTEILGGTGIAGEAGGETIVPHKYNERFKELIYKCLRDTVSENMANKVLGMMNPSKTTIDKLSINLPETTDSMMFAKGGNVNTETNKDNKKSYARKHDTNTEKSILLNIMESNEAIYEKLGTGITVTGLAMSKELLRLLRQSRRKVGGFFSDVYDGFKRYGVLGGILNLGKAAVHHTTKNVGGLVRHAFTNKVCDVFLRAENENSIHGERLIKASEFANGLIFADKELTKPIYSVADLRPPVYRKIFDNDEVGYEEAITEAQGDFGLVDEHGNSLVSIGGRIGRYIHNVVAKPYRAIFSDYTKNKFKGGLNAVKSIFSGVWDAYCDVYDKNDLNTPLIEGRHFKDGHVVKIVNSKQVVVPTVFDIDAPCYLLEPNDKGEYELIHTTPRITEKHIANRSLVHADGTPIDSTILSRAAAKFRRLLGWGVGGIGSLTGKSLSITGTILGVSLTAAGAIAKAAATAFKAKDPYIDAFILDANNELKIALVGRDIQYGNRYFFVNKKGEPDLNKPVKSAYGIDRPVWDAKKERMAITEADLKNGVYDRLGFRLSRWMGRSLAGKVFTTALGAIGLGVKATWKLGKAILKVPLSIIKGIAGALGPGGAAVTEFITQGWNSTLDFFRNNTVSRQDLSEIVGRHLIDIYGFLYRYMPRREYKAGDHDNDGDVDGSWEDYEQRRKEREKRREATKDDKDRVARAAGGTGAGDDDDDDFDVSDGLMTAILGKDLLPRHLFKAVKNFIGRKWRIFKVLLKRKLGRKISKLTRGLWSKVGSLFSGGNLAKAALGGAGKTVAGVGAATMLVDGVYYAHKGIKYVTTDNANEKLLRMLRFKLYGVDVKYWEAIEDLETDTYDAWGHSRPQGVDRQRLRQFGYKINFLTGDEMAMGGDKADYLYQWYIAKFIRIYYIYTDIIRKTCNIEPGEQPKASAIPQENFANIRNTMEANLPKAINPVLLQMKLDNSSFRVWLRRRKIDAENSGLISSKYDAKSLNPDEGLINTGDATDHFKYALNEFSHGNGLNGLWAGIKGIGTPFGKIANRVWDMASTDYFWNEASRTKYEDAWNDVKFHYYGMDRKGLDNKHYEKLADALTEFENNQVHVLDGEQNMVLTDLYDLADRIYSNTILLQIQDRLYTEGIQNSSANLRSEARNFIVSWYRRIFMPVFGCYAVTVRAFTGTEKGDNIVVDNIDKDKRTEALHVFENECKKILLNNKDANLLKFGYEGFIDYLRNRSQEDIEKMKKDSEGMLLDVEDLEDEERYDRMQNQAGADMSKGWALLNEGDVSKGLSYTWRGIRRSFTAWAESRSTSTAEFFHGTINSHKWESRFFDYGFLTADLENFSDFSIAAPKRVKVIKNLEKITGEMIYQGVTPRLENGTIADLLTYTFYLERVCKAEFGIYTLHSNEGAPGMTLEGKNGKMTVTVYYSWSSSGVNLSRLKSDLIRGILRVGDNLDANRVTEIITQAIDYISFWYEIRFLSVFNTFMDVVKDYGVSPDSIDVDVIPAAKRKEALARYNNEVRQTLTREDINKFRLDAEGFEEYLRQSNEYNKDIKDGVIDNKSSAMAKYYQKKARDVSEGLAKALTDLAPANTDISEADVTKIDKNIYKATLDVQADLQNRDKMRKLIQDYNASLLGLSDIDKNGFSNSFTPEQEVLATLMAVTKAGKYTPNDGDISDEFTSFLSDVYKYACADKFDKHDESRDELSKRFKKFVLIYCKHHGVIAKPIDDIADVYSGKGYLTDILRGMEYIGGKVGILGGSNETEEAYNRVNILLRNQYPHATSRLDGNDPLMKYYGDWYLHVFIPYYRFLVEATNLVLNKRNKTEESEKFPNLKELSLTQARYICSKLRAFNANTGQYANLRIGEGKGIHDFYWTLEKQYEDRNKQTNTQSLNMANNVPKDTKPSWVQNLDKPIENKSSQPDWLKNIGKLRDQEPENGTQHDSAVEQMKYLNSQYLGMSGRDLSGSQEYDTNVPKSAVILKPGTKTKYPKIKQNGTTATVKERQYIWDYLTGMLGLSEIQAAGVMGNMVVESQLAPDIINGIDAAGLCQWLGPRRRAMEAYAIQHKLNPFTVEAQMGFLYDELTGSERRALRALKRQTDISDAALSFMNVYERPSPKEKADSGSTRVQAAKEIYAMFTKNKDSNVATEAADNAPQSNTNDSTGTTGGNNTLHHESSFEYYIPGYLNQNNPTKFGINDNLDKTRLVGGSKSYSGDSPTLFNNAASYDLADINTTSANGGMVLPTDSNVITSQFGPRNVKGGSRNHKGIDLRARMGSPIKALRDGVVIKAGGNYNEIFIQHSDGIITKYLHNSRIRVRNGQHVKAGDVIALAGGKGPNGVNQYSPHLHLGVFKGNTPIDPEVYLRKAGIKLALKDTKGSPHNAPLSDVDAAGTTGNESLPQETAPSRNKGKDIVRKARDALKAKMKQETADVSANVKAMYPDTNTVEQPPVITNTATEGNNANIHTQDTIQKGITDANSGNTPVVAELKIISGILQAFKNDVSGFINMLRGGINAKTSGTTQMNKSVTTDTSSNNVTLDDASLKYLTEQLINYMQQVGLAGNSPKTMPTKEKERRSSLSGYMLQGNKVYN